jgi:putative phosphoserine phosphatase/1-acylglycerol-3-phosphate O-acyltransferase
MQAGVPILPIVIHNAIDVQPKGDFVFRPATVLVEVLDPIDPSTWTAEDMATRIAEVRNLYLRKLGHPEEEVPAPKSAKASAAATPGATATKRGPRRPAKAAASRARMRKTNGSASALKQQ